MRREGRGLFVSARRGCRSHPCPGQAPSVRSPPSGHPPPPSLGLGGLSAPWGRARIAVCSLLSSRMGLRRPIGAGRWGEGQGSWVSGYLCVFLGLSLSLTPPLLVSVPSPVPVACRRGFPWRAPWAQSDRETKKLGWGFPSPSQTPSAPPTVSPCPHGGPPSDRPVEAPRLAHRTRAPGRVAPGMRGWRVGPSGRFFWTRS